MVESIIGRINMAVLEAHSGILYSNESEHSILHNGLPRWLSGKERICLSPWGWEDPLEYKMATHSAFLPGKSHGQRSLAGYSPGVIESQTQLHT